MAKPDKTAIVADASAASDQAQALVITAGEPAPQIGVKAPARSPETVPVPGGGQWSWDADKLDWVDRNPKPAKPDEPPVDAA